MSKIDELLEYAENNILKLKKEELLDINRKLRLQANKRLSILEKKELSRFSYAYQEVTQFLGEKPRFRGGNKKFGQLRTEFKQLSRFLKAKTSSSKGALEAKEQQKTFFSSMGIDIVNDESRRWERIERLLVEARHAGILYEEMRPSEAKLLLKELVYDDFDTSDDDILDMLEDRIRDRYNEKTPPSSDELRRTSISPFRSGRND